ncbi:syntaphilin [Heteronotia binoei]|uniref:syntaphilin n=1 Tax=Heteronotia binoei TaxID=13085 RepID=UPI00292CE426|nr:syntaphilin [Heteronotia binoei]
MSLPGSRRPSTGSRSCEFYGKSGFASFFKPAAPAATPTEKQLLLPASRRPSPPVSMRDTYGTASLSSSSNSGSCKGSDSSPTPRRPMKYLLCSDNHGIKPPTPEQYLTPLQQKEVCIRHLRARLKDTHERLQDRDSEIDDLKMQLSRMQEDWIEEECHRVEAQLALKEARKEIKQLKQVIDTVKNNLIEKDKGLQKYFVDINIQNKKLETLLHSMEVAQNGTVKEEGAAESAGGSPARSLTRSSTYTKLSDQGAADRNVGGSQTISVDEMADSGFVAADDSLSRTDLLEQSSLLSSGVDCGGDETSIQTSSTLGSRMPTSSTYEKLMGSQHSVEAAVQASCMQEQAIQTDFVHYQPDLDTILEKVLKSQACGAGNPTAGWASEVVEGVEPNNSEVCIQNCPDGNVDLAAAEPNLAMVVSAGVCAEDPDGPPGYPRSVDDNNPAVHQPSGDSQSISVMCALNEEAADQSQEEAAAASIEPKSYWSRHFIVDLLAIVVPAVPTVAWLCRSQRRQGQPIYNISSLLRGCCTVALHSIRKISCRSVTSPSGPASQP